MHYDVDNDGDQEPLVSAGLKVVHKDSGFRYTVDSISPRDVMLITPEGEKILVNKDEFEQDYRLD